ncbi:YbhN family protein [Nocardioides koreensis]|uniref:lysylphosphatidylglycerol synthase transmembrane domain-containing protein n=1 Tax=Nocardioides koreensis TaxID=433651 RepID=UPI0031D6AEB0
MSKPVLPPSPGGDAGRRVPPILESESSSPLQKTVRFTLSLLLLYLIFGLLIPSFASYQDVWDALTSLGAAAVIVLTLLTLLVESCKAGAFALMIEPLRFRDAFLAQESAAVVSNTVPGPSGTAARYVSYRKLGISNEDFATSYVVNSSISNGLPLVLPSLGLVLLSTQKDVPASVWTLALIGLGVSLVLVALAVLVLRSERFAYGFGVRVGRFLNWVRGVVRRPPGEELGETVVEWRHDVVDIFRARWLGLVAVFATRELATYLILLVSLRALGVGSDVLTAVEIFAVYTVVRLATLVEITPGNVGISEALYIAALDWAADGRDSDAIVAAVFVFRMFTYLGPILLGGGCSYLLARRFRGMAATSAP